MATVKVVIRTNKQRKDGKYPLFLRITQNRRTQFMSIGQHVNINEWDEVKGKVKKNHQNSSRMNAYIAHRVAGTTMGTTFAAFLCC